MIPSQNPLSFVCSPYITDDLAEQKKQMALGWTIAKEMVMDNEDQYKIAYDHDSAEFKPSVGNQVLYHDKSRRNQ